MPWHDEPGFSESVDGGVARSVGKGASQTRDPPSRNLAPGAVFVWTGHIAAEWQQCASFAVSRRGNRHRIHRMCFHPTSDETRHDVEPELMSARSDLSGSEDIAPLKILPRRRGGSEVVDQFEADLNVIEQALNGLTRRGSQSRTVH